MNDMKARYHVIERLPCDVANEQFMLPGHAPLEVLESVSMSDCPDTYPFAYCLPAIHSDVISLRVEPLMKYVFYLPHERKGIRSGSRSSCPRAQRYSIATFRLST